MHPTASVSADTLPASPNVPAVAPGEWKKIRIPFHKFYLTARGQLREQQRDNDNLQVVSFGFLFKKEVAVCACVYVCLGGCGWVGIYIYKYICMCMCMNVVDAVYVKSVSAECIRLYGAAGKMIH